MARECPCSTIQLNRPLSPQLAPCPMNPTSLNVPRGIRISYVGRHPIKVSVPLAFGSTIAQEGPRIIIDVPNIVVLPPGILDRLHIVDGLCGTKISQMPVLWR